MLSIKILANNFMYLSNPKKLLANLINPKSQKDNVKFALFLALMNATYKALLCTLRRFVKDDRFNSVVASVLAAFWISMEPQKRRFLLIILLFSRMLDTCTRFTINHKICQSQKYFNVFIWALCSVMQQYICCYERDCLNPGVWKFLRKWAIFE